MTWKNWISYTGIFTYPIFAWLFWFVLQNLPIENIIPQGVQMAIIYVLPVMFPLIITITNREREARGQTDFSFASVYGLGDKDEKHSKAYLDAAYPDVPKIYRSKIPKDLVLGKHKGNYIFCPLTKGSMPNAFCVGTPGSGKSVLLLGWLYSMLFRNEIAEKGKVKAANGFNFYAVDIKGEIFTKLLQISANEYSAKDYPDFHVIHFSNRSSYGYDVLYRIHKDNVSEDDMIKTVTDIAECLILSTENESPYFAENAKKLFTSFLYFYAKQGMEFVDIIKRIMRTNLEEHIRYVLKEASDKNMGFVIDKLASFVGKTGNESIQDVEATLQIYLSVFSYPSVEWALKTNPNRTSPAKLRDGTTNIVFAIEENTLTMYQAVFRLICMQIMKECEEFEEGRENATLLVLDEAARLSRIDALDASMSTLRSRNTGLICIFQTLSQFRYLYPSELAKTILNLCELKIFLSGADRDTTEYVSALAGTYQATTMSYRRRGAFGGKSDANYSTQRRDIVDGQSMMGLREKGEAILFIFGRYARVKKFKYYEDPILAPLLKRKQEEKTKAKQEA